MYNTFLHVYLTLYSLILSNLILAFICFRGWVVFRLSSSVRDCPRFLPTEIVGKIPFQRETPEFCPQDTAQNGLWAPLFAHRSVGKIPWKKNILPCIIRGVLVPCESFKSFLPTNLWAKMESLMWREPFRLYSTVLSTVGVRRSLSSVGENWWELFIHSFTLLL